MHTYMCKNYINKKGLESDHKTIIRYLLTLSEEVVSSKHTGGAKEEKHSMFLLTNSALSSSWPSSSSSSSPLVDSLMGKLSGDLGDSAKLGCLKDARAVLAAALICLVASAARGAVVCVFVCVYD